MEATEQSALAEIRELQTTLPKGAVELLTLERLPAAKLRFLRDGSYFSLFSAPSPAQADIEVTFVLPECYPLVPAQASVHLTVPDLFQAAEVIAFAASLNGDAAQLSGEPMLGQLGVKATAWLLARFQRNRLRYGREGRPTIGSGSYSDEATQRTACSSISAPAYTDAALHEHEREHKHGRCLLVEYLGTGDLELLAQVYAKLDLLSLSRISRTCRVLSQVRWPSIDFMELADRPGRPAPILTAERLRYLLRRRPRSLALSAPIFTAYMPLQPDDIHDILSSPQLRRLQIERILVKRDNSRFAHNLADCLKASPWFLVDLSLRSVGLSSGDVWPLLQLITREPGLALTHLDLSGNPLGKRLSNGIPMVLASKWTRLEVLRLADCRLHCPMRLQQAYEMAFAGSSRLRILDISHNPGASCVAVAALLVGRSLRELHLANSGLDDALLLEVGSRWDEQRLRERWQSRVADARAAPASSPLLLLDLSLNRICADGWFVTADMLGDLTCLRTLKLGGLNVATQTEARYFFRAVHAANTEGALRHLDLRHVETDSKYERDLRETALVWLSKCYTFETLNFEGCSWFDVRAAAKLRRRQRYLTADDGHPG